MKKKLLDDNPIVNELRNASAFFRKDSSLEEEKPVGEFVSSETSFQVHKETNQQRTLETSPQRNKETKKQGNNGFKRYSTYLTPESILAMQRLALDIGKKDYELFQEAVERYLKKKGY